jgi:hypothetical protein
MRKPTYAELEAENASLKLALHDSDDFYLPCSCSHLHHMVSFTFHPYRQPLGEPEEFEAYVQVSLDYERTLWGRIKSALRYVCKKTCGYGDVSEIVVRDQDLSGLKRWVLRAMVEAEKRRGQ